MVFWGHVSNGIERYLPLMVSLKDKGLKPLLFYQNYDFKDGLSRMQIKTIQAYGLDVMDYSRFLKGDLSLRTITFFVNIFKYTTRCRFFYNKLIGLRSKLLQLRINENLIGRMLRELMPTIGFFDNISLVEYCAYPYGSYYIKKVSDQLGIKSFDIFNGMPNHPLKLARKYIDFDRYYVPHEHEKQKYYAEHIERDAPILVFGDPRFDTNWKESIKRVFSEDVKKNIERMGIKSKTKILYICPNLECIGGDSEKYRNIADIARAAKTLGNTALLIKPHPRYRYEDKIRLVMKDSGFNDFFILEDDPLVCYLEHVDFIISVATAAFFDFLPEGHKKIVVYDRGDFCQSTSLVNIFKEGFNYFNNYDDLLAFLKGKNAAGSMHPDIEGFCSKWVAGGNGLDTVVENMSNDILSEFNKLRKGHV